MLSMSCLCLVYVTFLLNPPPPNIRRLQVKTKKDLQVNYTKSDNDSCKQGELFLRNSLLYRNAN